MKISDKMAEEHNLLGKIECLEENGEKLLFFGLKVVPKDITDFKFKLEEQFKDFEGFKKLSVYETGGLYKKSIKIFLEYPYIEDKENKSQNEAEWDRIKNKIPEIEEKCINVLDNVVLEK